MLSLNLNSTGSGKTYIALELIKHYLPTALEYEMNKLILEVIFG